MKGLLVLLAVTAVMADKACPEIQVQEDFDLGVFASKRWYIQEQMAVKYLPKEQNSCVYAEYQQLSSPTFWGFDIQVHNFAYERDNNSKHDSGTFICAKTTDVPAKLNVGLCYAPRISGWTTGSYWVLRHDEEAGYAVVIGGQPSLRVEGGCRTGSGVNNAGLWIFTREQKRNEELVEMGRNATLQYDLDLSVLNKVDQTDCTF